MTVNAREELDYIHDNMITRWGSVMTYHQLVGRQ